MNTTATRVATTVDRLPSAEKPGRESRLCGPTRDDAEDIAAALFEDGEKGLRELIALLETQVEAENKSYKPRYAVRLVTLFAGVAGRDAERRAWLDTLTAALGGDDLGTATRRVLCEELQLIGDASAVKVLGDLLADKDTFDVASAALTAIGRAAAPAFEKALPEASGAGRIAIVQALGTLRHAAAVPALLELVEDTESETRISVASALAEIGTPEAAAGVLRILERAEGWERVKTMAACRIVVERLQESVLDGEAGEVHKILQSLVEKTKPSAR